MIVSQKKKLQALEILRNYSGANSYILMLKRNIAYTTGVTLNDFEAEYVLDNYTRQPVLINRIIKIVDWYGEKKQKDWGTEFVPKKLLVTTYLGETATTYNCYVKYRQSVGAVMAFIPKRAVLTDMFAKDYHNVEVDFDRYDRLSTAKDPDRKIMEHQKDAVKFLLSRKRCILADDQGLGKSLELAVAAIEFNADATVIICPQPLKTNWKKELSWYVPEKDITIIDSLIDKKKGELEKILGYGEGRSGKKRDELLQEAKERGYDWRDNRFVIINYEILDKFYKIPTTRSKANVKDAYHNSPLLKYIENKKALIIVDEAHKLSRSSSNRFKLMNHLINRCNPEGLFFATGTPITNDPSNLFCILQLLHHPLSSDRNYYLERYSGAKKIPKKGEWDKWTKIYLSQIGYSSIRQLDSDGFKKMKEFLDAHMIKITINREPAHQEELAEAISSVYLRRTKMDLGTLPEKTVHEVHYELSSAQQVEYDKLWAEYEAEQTEKNEGEDKELNKQLLEGAIYRAYLANEMVPNTEKLCDSIISRGDKVIIATCYDEELNMLKGYYGDRCIVYNGKMNARQKDEAIEKFKNSPSVMVFIGNIAAAGTGLTLTVSHDMIFNNMSYSPSDNNQMMDRVHRIGQKKPVDIYFQIFDNTQYAHMWDIVMKKEVTINAVIKKESDKKCF